MFLSGCGVMMLGIDNILYCLVVLMILVFICLMFMWLVWVCWVKMGLRLFVFIFMVFCII